MSKNKNDFFNKSSVVCGIICAVLCLGVRIISGTPFDMIHKLNSSELIPPMWIFNLLWLVWSYLAGTAAGAVICNVSLGRICGREEIQAYKGGLFFVSLLFLNLIWYPLLFINEALFISLAISLIAVICSILCAAAWQKASRMSGLIMAAHTLWLSYVFIVNFSVFIHN